MDAQYKSVVLNFLGLSLGVLIIQVGIIFLSDASKVGAGLAGYVLSFVFVGSNLVVLRDFRSLSNSAFNKRFFISLGVRFVLVLAAFAVMVKTLKIHQIYFTVSFVISYICHSVIEIILINKLLETDNEI